MTSLMVVSGGESLTSQLVQARGCPVSPTEKDSISLKRSLVLPSALTHFLSHKSTRRGGRVECGEKFPCVHAVLEGQQQLEECVKGKKGWVGLGWSSLRNRPVADETEEGARGNRRAF